MKKFIPLIILFAGILSAVSCREADEVNDSPITENVSAKVMKNIELNPSTSKVNDSIANSQATEENDPVKTPITW